MFWNKNFLNRNIDPDEIFLDSQNIPGFSNEEFEGVIEKAITRQTPILMSVVLFLLMAGLVARAGFLQVVRGAEYFERARDNSLEMARLDAERGNIYDRRGVELAWNATDGDKKIRSYSSLPGLSHVLGYVGYPTEEEVKNGFSHDLKYGRSGIEKYLDERLRGQFGERLAEVDARGKIISESAQNLPIPGDRVVLSIDAEMQSKLYEVISALGKDRGFEGGAGTVIDTTTGEVLAITSWPEFDSNAMSSGNSKKISAMGARSFFFRAVSGLYAPGSIVKPIVALAALKEGIVDEYRQILSTGSISIPNPYNSTQFSIFRDWKAHGWVDMRHAIAASSDVYFYTVGGGYGDIHGLGTTKLGQYFRFFGLGEKTGIDFMGEENGFIPTPDWKKANVSDGSWRVGDTYNLSIGQGYLQVTPLQMAMVATTIALDGVRLKPQLIKEIRNNANEVIQKSALEQIGKVEMPAEFYLPVKEGMKMAVEGGTAAALSGLGVKMAGKTGTAEVGSLKKHVNSWVLSFLPYDHPRLAMAIVMENGSITNLVGAPAVGRQFLTWLIANRPEYIGQGGEN
jgi:penicillin-binding protein 2